MVSVAVRVEQAENQTGPRWARTAPITTQSIVYCRFTLTQSRRPVQ